MGKPKLHRVPKVKKPTEYQIFINNEISKMKLKYPTLKLKKICKKAVEKWKQQEKCKSNPKTRSSGSKTVSFCDEVSVKSPTPSTSFEVEEPRKQTPFQNKVKTVTSPAGIMKKSPNGNASGIMKKSPNGNASGIMKKSPNGNASGIKKKKNVPKSKDESAKLRRSIIHFSPKKDNQEIVPVSSFPKLQNKNCLWSYKNVVSGKKSNQDLDLGTLKKQLKLVANKKEEASQLVYSKRKEKSLDKETSSCNFKIHEVEEETTIEEVSPVSSSTIPKTPTKRGQYQNVVVISPFSKKARSNIGDLSQKSKEETFNILKSNSTSSKDCKESERKVSRTLVIEEQYNKGLTQNKSKGVESFSPSYSESDYQSAHEPYAYLKLKTKEISRTAKTSDKTLSQQTGSEKSISNDIETSKHQDDITKTIEKNKNQLKIFNVSSDSGSAESKKEIQIDSIEETMEELEIIPGKLSLNSNSSQSSWSGSLAYDVIPPTPTIGSQNSGPPSISLSAETLPFLRNRFILEDKNSQDYEIESSKASTIYDENSQDNKVDSDKASTVYYEDGCTFLALKDDTAQDHFYDNEDPLLPIKDSKHNNVSESSNLISQFKEVKNRKKTLFNPSSKLDSLSLHSSPHLSLDFDSVVNSEELEMKEESDATIKRKTCKVEFDLEAELAKRAKIVESMYEYRITNELDDLALEDSEQFENSTKTQSSFSFPSQSDKRNDIGIEAIATSSDISVYGSSDQNQLLEKETLTKELDENDDFYIDIDNFDLSAEARRHGIDLSSLSPINDKDLEYILDYCKEMKGWKALFDKSP